MVMAMPTRLPSVRKIICPRGAPIIVSTTPIVATRWSSFTALMSMVINGGLIVPRRSLMARSGIKGRAGMRSQTRLTPTTEAAAMTPVSRWAKDSRRGSSEPTGQSTSNMTARVMAARPLVRPMARNRPLSAKAEAASASPPRMQGHSLLFFSSSFSSFFI